MLGVEAWGERQVLGEAWEPSITCDAALQLSPAGRRWQDSLPATVAPADDGGPDGDPPAFLYVWEHAPLRSNVLALGRADGVAVPVSWTATWDPHFDANFRTGARVRLEGVALFTRIGAGRVSESEARAELARFLEDSAFRFEVDEHGVSSLVPLP